MLVGVGVGLGVVVAVGLVVGVGLCVNDAEGIGVVGGELEAAGVLGAGLGALGLAAEEELVGVAEALTDGEVEADGDDVAVITTGTVVMPLEGIPSRKGIGSVCAPLSVTSKCR